MTGLVQVINRSSSDDLKEEKDIKIEVRLKDLYVLNNYIQSIQHLPGVIEIDALDSFKMLSRRIGRIEKSNFSFNNEVNEFCFKIQCSNTEVKQRLNNFYQK